MEDHIHILPVAKLRNTLVAGDYDPMEKETFRSIQRPLDHRFSAKICHQFIAAEPFSQTGCHDDTAQFWEKCSVQFLVGFDAGIPVGLILTEKLLSFRCQDASSTVFSSCISGG